MVENLLIVASVPALAGALLWFSSWAESKLLSEAPVTSRRPRNPRRRNREPI